MKCCRCHAPLDADKAAAELALGVVNWNVCGPCGYAEANPSDEANVSPEAFARHLTAAHGFLELGLPHDAWNELDAIEPPQRRAEVPVLGLRMAIFQALEKWGAMAEVCRHLAAVEPDEACWFLRLAYATWRAEGIPAARDILLRAMLRFPREPVISCYAMQSEDPPRPYICFDEPGNNWWPRPAPRCRRVGPRLAASLLQSSSSSKRW